MGHTHVLPRPDGLYDGGFLDRFIHKARTHPKSTLVVGLALATGLTGGGFLLGSRGHYTAEGLNAAINVPAQTQVVEHPPVVPAIPALPARPPESTATRNPAYASAPSSSAGNGPAGRKPDTVSSPKLYTMGRSTSVLNEYFNLTEEQIVKAGFRDYKFSVTDLGPGTNGKNVMAIRLSGLDVKDGNWHSICESADYCAKQYYGTIPK